MDDDQASHHGENHVQNQDQGEATFGSPVLDTARDIVAKNSPPSILPKLHGIPTEDLDSFLFEFDILCRSYNYNQDGKLELFSTTLKDYAFRWLMGLEDTSILTWDDMK